MFFWHVKGVNYLLKQIFPKIRLTSKKGQVFALVSLDQTVIQIITSIGVIGA